MGETAKAIPTQLLISRDTGLAQTWPRLRHPHWAEAHDEEWVKTGWEDERWYRRRVHVSSPIWIPAADA
jgi:hypothetical protein